MLSKIEEEQNCAHTNNGGKSNSNFNKDLISESEARFEWGLIPNMVKGENYSQYDEDVPSFIIEEDKKFTPNIR